MPPCLAQVADGAVDAAEAVLGAGLLVLVADLAGKIECGGVLAACVKGLAVGAEGFAEAVQCRGSASQTAWASRCCGPSGLA